MRACTAFRSGCIRLTQSISLGYDINVETVLNRRVEFSVVNVSYFHVKLKVLNVVVAAVARLRGTV